MATERHGHVRVHLLICPIGRIGPICRMGLPRYAQPHQLPITLTKHVPGIRKVPSVDGVPQTVQLPPPHMLETIRKRQRILLIIVTVLTIVSFVWFMNPTRTRNTPQAVIGKINGKSITVEELQNVDRSAQIAYLLQFSELLQQLTACQGSREQQSEFFAWKGLLIRD